MVDTSYGNLVCKNCGTLYLKCEEVNGKRKWNHRKFCPTCKDIVKTPTSSKVSEELFRQSIQDSFSIREAITKMGIKAAGGNYLCFHRRVERLGIDTSHFTGMAHMTGRTLGPKRSIQDYFDNKAIIASFKLKNRILSEGLKNHECEKCGLSSWLGDKIPLELHHVNGNHSDNTFENLQFLCPNCHALTENYRGKNQDRRKT